jgi:hypothetical protein
MRGCAGGVPWSEESTDNVYQKDENQRENTLWALSQLPCAEKSKMLVVAD